LPDPSESELRQIKRILLGILVCLIVIVLVMVPELVPVLLIAGMVYWLVLVFLGSSQAARLTAQPLWLSVSSLWRR
jgi:hypothetical protein